MDVCLTNYGHCNYVSGKHACIFYDEVRAGRKAVGPRGHTRFPLFQWAGGGSICGEDEETPSSGFFFFFLFSFPPLPPHPRPRPFGTTDFLPQNTKHYELLNYSEHGTTVDNVLYSCDFSEKAAFIPPSSMVAKVQSVISKFPRPVPWRLSTVYTQTHRHTRCPKGYPGIF